MTLDSELKRTWLVAFLAIGTAGNVMGQDPFGDTDFSDASAQTAGDEFGSPFDDVGQDNGSGDTTDDFSTDQTLPEGSGVLGGIRPVSPPSTERNAVVRSLLTNPPQTHAELGRAIQLMSRIRRWDEVERWLNVADRSGITEVAAAAMVESAGVDVFQRLSTPLVDLPEAQKKIAIRIVAQANAYRQNPATIAQAVNTLQLGKPAEWERAVRLIQSSGYLGVETLLNRSMVANAPIPNVAMGEALKRMGPTARDAWLVGIRSPHADVRANLLTLAARTKDPSYARELSVIFADAANLPPSMKQFAKEWLAQNGNGSQGSDPWAAADRADRELVDRLKAYTNIKLENDEPVEVRWELDPTGRKLKTAACRPAELLWQRVLEEANNVIRTDAAMSRANALATAVILQDADGTKDENFLLNSVALPVEDFEKYEFACLVWDAAKEYDLPTAQARILQKLGRFSAPMPIEVRERLVQGLDSGYRPVRYMAASSLMQSIQKGRTLGVDNGSFQGRGRLDRVVLEMTQIRPNRQAIIVGGSDSLRTHVRSMLEQFGYSCEEFSNGRSLIARCKEGAPIDEVYIVHRVYEMEFGELLQRLRGTPSAAKAPVAMLADSLSSRELEFMVADSRVQLGTVAPDISELEPTIRAMRLLGQGMDLAEEARLLWRDEAQDFRESLKPTAVVPTRATLASSIPQSPLGQQELIRKAIDELTAVPEREQASQLFVQSVRQFGLQISSESADGLYDVYNDRAKSDIDLRSSLGRILDAIEANRGERDWASVRP